MRSIYWFVKLLRPLGFDFASIATVNATHSAGWDFFQKGAARSCVATLQAQLDLKCLIKKEGGKEEEGERKWSMDIEIMHQDSKE
jgi:hypothetical protein